MHITGIYAALATVLVVFLAFRVIFRRQSTKTGIGDGGDHELAKRIRVHANAVETLPLGLILLFLVEWNQTLPMLVHVFGIALIVGRVLHAFGLSRSSGASAGRVVGMIVTLATLLVMAVLLLWQTFVMAAI
jgi:uncharacterized membrane protein YecN with MAPEG domain